MSNCHYMELKPQKIEGHLSHVNRMGTENFKLADFEEQTEIGTFRRAPINLGANRKETYTHANRETLLKTQNSEALIEYYITKWQYNSQG